VPKKTFSKFKKTFLLCNEITASSVRNTNKEMGINYTNKHLVD